MFTHIVGGACGLMGLKSSTASNDFFKRLELRTVTTFFIGFFGAFGDFAAGSTSCDSGSSTIGVSVIGAAAANIFGFSSSLRKEAKDKIHLLKSIGKR
jgi:hypothetical protein